MEKPLAQLTDAELAAAVHFIEGRVDCLDWQEAKVWSEAKALIKRVAAQLAE